MWIAALACIASFVTRYTICVLMRTRPSGGHQGLPGGHGLRSRKVSQPPLSSYKSHKAFPKALSLQLHNNSDSKVFLKQKFFFNKKNIHGKIYHVFVYYQQFSNIIDWCYYAHLGLNREQRVFSLTYCKVLFFCILAYSKAK